MQCELYGRSSGNVLISTLSSTQSSDNYCCSIDYSTIYFDCATFSNIIRYTDERLSASQRLKRDCNNHECSIIMFTLVETCSGFAIELSI